MAATSILEPEVAALIELRKRQAHESEEAGTAYGAGLADLDWYAEGDKYVVVDQLGMPLHPESYSDESTRVLKLAGLPKIRLHDSRHTTLSLLEKAGVPISIISKVGGHKRYGPKNAEGPSLATEEMTLTCGYVARSEGLEPPTF